MSEKRYFYLMPGDVLQSGDEYNNPITNEWHSISPAMRNTLATAPELFRRPIAEPTENGGEVGTPRTDAAIKSAWVIGADIVSPEFARQLERELIATITRREELHKRLLKDANEIEGLKKERDEWREIAGKMAKLLDENCYGYEQYEVDVTTCNSCGSSRGHNDDCEIKEALAAYELKAKEGV